MTEVLKKRPEYEQLAQTIFIQLIRPDNKNLVVDAIKEHLTEGMMIIIFTLMVFDKSHFTHMKTVICVGKPPKKWNAPL